MAQLAAALAVGATNQGLRRAATSISAKGFTQIVIGAEAQPSTRWLSASRAVRISTGSWRPLMAPFAQDIQPVDTGQRQVEDRRVIGRRA